ncbi:MAG: ABC transporter permease [Clostridiales bacterium]|nr:ABC transporter permease [Clostridiales bacterium]
MMDEKNMRDIAPERFRFVRSDERIHDEKLKTKPIGYFKDAWLRFRKDKSAVVAFALIVMLMLFSIIVPFVSYYDVTFRDGYYKTLLPKLPFMQGTGFWDGTASQRETQGGYDYLDSIGVETGRKAIVKLNRKFEDANGIAYYDMRVDSYAKVGYVYLNVDKDQYAALMDYQDRTGRQVLYPMPRTWQTNFVMGNGGANFWYKLADEKATSSGLAVRDEAGAFVPNYITSDDPEAMGYGSLRIPGDDGQGGWYVYAQRNQSGYRVRVDYMEYFRYVHGVLPCFVFGTNVYGQDIFSCLAAGGRLSFILAISISIINIAIGAVYGAIEGYYGGWVDIIMERISDILSSVPFIVVATLFQMHLAEKVGVLASLLFAFVLTGWVHEAVTVRMQFYRFKGQEYVLAARTLGAKDGRLIFKHIFPNALGTIITSSVLSIPGVIFSESMLSYLHIINLETSSLTSIGTMLSSGQGLLSTYPHIILFPALFISILEISFNLFGNGLRDAFNPSLRGVDD